MELSQSPLLPSRLEDEYFKGALKMMGRFFYRFLLGMMRECVLICATIVKPDSVHQQAILSALFNEPPKPVRGFLYDADLDHPEHTALNDIVHERLSSVFRLHGAVDMEPPLLMPISGEDEQATFIDRHGDVVVLPSNNLVPFARLAARANVRRIKRYHISDIYKPRSITRDFLFFGSPDRLMPFSPVPGHPRVTKAAVFDIITPDLTFGAIAAGAEILSMISDLLNSFPNLALGYEIHISHSTSECFPSWF